MLVGGYSTSRFGFEDYDYWMRMNALFRVRHLGRRGSLYRYRVHRKSLSSRDPELQITQRVRDFMAPEAARREFFAQPFDVAFFGTHPWFEEMGDRYRGAGHRVIEGKGSARKSLALVGDGCPLDRRIAGAVVRLTNVTECSLEAEGVSQPLRLHANSAGDLLYPILAGANSLAYARRRESPEQRAALQNA
jgi:hypothetical protein